MSLIKNLIPQQNFELAGMRIGEILADEFNNQGFIHGDQTILPNCFVEALTPFDKNELPALNVSFSGGTYGNEDQKSSEGTYQYFVDIYSNSPATADNPGGVLATRKLQRMLGMARAIIKNPAYRTLGYQPPFNGSITVSSISIGEATEQDALSTIAGRLVVTVTLTENVELKTAVLISISNTTVKLYNTNKGYLWTTQTVMDSGVFTEQFTDTFN